MYILGIETSTKTGSVAILSTKGVVAQYCLNIEVTHSERLMTMVNRVLGDAGMTISQVDGFAVAIGPGSFTGLRIGLSTVKGLAIVLNKPVAAVPTLLALAWNIPYPAHPICAMLDARKNEVYAAFYVSDGCTLRQTTPEAAISLSHLRSHISGKTIFTGEAAYIHREEIESLFRDQAVIAPRTVVLPSAATVAELGLQMIITGSYIDPDSLVPLYIRRPEAEVAWEKRTQSK
jgi:tRNA threonylcarbamoyladenosine biosynthesis protein TsaB